MSIKIIFYLGKEKEEENIASLFPANESNVHMMALQSGSYNTEPLPLARTKLGFNAN